MKRKAWSSYLIGHAASPHFNVKSVWNYKVKNLVEGGAEKAVAFGFHTTWGCCHKKKRKETFWMAVKFAGAEKVCNFWPEIDELHESTGEVSCLKKFSITHLFIWIFVFVQTGLNMNTKHQICNHMRARITQIRSRRSKATTPCPKVYLSLCVGFQVTPWPVAPAELGSWVNACLVAPRCAVSLSQTASRVNWVSVIFPLL